MFIKRTMVALALLTACDTKPETNPLALVVQAATADAKEAAPRANVSTIMCCDGTRSPTCYTKGRGCCSHHGGVCDNGLATGHVEEPPVKESTKSAWVGFDETLYYQTAGETCGSIHVTGFVGGGRYDTHGFCRDGLSLDTEFAKQPYLICHNYNGDGKIVIFMLEDRGMTIEGKANDDPTNTITLFRREVACLLYMQGQAKEAAEAQAAIERKEADARRVAIEQEEAKASQIAIANARKEVEDQIQRDLARKVAGQVEAARKDAERKEAERKDAIARADAQQRSALRRADEARAQAKARKAEAKAQAEATQNAALWAQAEIESARRKEMEIQERANCRRVCANARNTLWDRCPRGMPDTDTCHEKAAQGGTDCMKRCDL